MGFSKSFQILINIFVLHKFNMFHVMNFAVNEFLKVIYNNWDFLVQDTLSRKHV